MILVLVKEKERMEVCYLNSETRIEKIYKELYY